MESKYLDLLDDEIREFIKRSEAFYPADAVDASIDEQRQFYDALCKSFDTGYPDSVTASDKGVETSFGTVPTRTYRTQDTNEQARIFYIHGGGFVVGGLESHDSICADICAGTGLEIVAIDYRLAPEHVHPVPFQDCLAVVQQVSERDNKSAILVGDSAGANLAAALSHRLRGNAITVLGQVLIYPALGAPFSSTSYIEHANAPMLTTADVKYYEHVRAKGADLTRDVTARPLADNDFSSLPETAIFIAECDPLADDGRLYNKALNEAGGNAMLYEGSGLVHGYLRARNMSHVARESFDCIVAEIGRVAAL